jgi:hypothetical protein
MGRDPLPGRGADEVVELETGATALALRYPCVMVCMNDVNTVSGRLLLDAAFGAHSLEVCRDALQQNPFYATEGITGAWPWGPLDEAMNCVRFVLRHRVQI